ncbi:response regulator [Paenibacillus cellulosilyticus]|nr:response regulator [Paenibacillus cellulosilyticus]QKS44282.1 response regulator [Paenibacillus cellulosilyticus]
MRSLLIVDDERNIRVGLKSMIDREFAGAYTFYFAADGEEALQVLDETEIDLVITDIRMPVMDGITLIQRLQERESRADVVILSGFDDFQYAKAAIRFDVKEYLLKPIVREELFRVLRRLEEEWQKKNEVADELRNTIALKAEFAITQLQNVLMHDRYRAEEVRELLGRAALCWLDEGFQVAIVRMNGGARAAERAEFMHRIDKIIGYENERRCIRFYDREERLVIITDSSTLIERLSTYMKEHPACGFQAGVSVRMSPMEAVRQGYRQAVAAVAYSVLLTAPDVIRAEELVDKSKSYKLPVEDIHKISNLLGLDREADIKRLLQHVLDIKTIMRYDISYLEGISHLLNEHVFDKVFQVYGEGSLEILKLHRTVGDIYNAPFHDYYYSVQSLLLLLNDYVRQVRSVYNDKSEMGRAISYIQERYHEDLNMAMVSNHVSLNYSYFSQAFKDHTGDTFVAYLRKLRLQRAKELLMTSDMKVYEISASVGFENVKHFTRVFKEVEGVSPLEYRAMNEALGAE